MELGLKRSSEIIYCHQFQNAHYFTFQHHWYQPHITVWSDQGATESCHCLHMCIKAYGMSIKGLEEHPRDDGEVTLLRIFDDSGFNKI